jgi:hypothetical protein
MTCIQETHLSIASNAALVRNEKMDVGDLKTISRLQTSRIETHISRI